MSSPLDPIKKVIDTLANTKVSGILELLKSVDRSVWIKLGVVAALSVFIGVFLVKPAYWGRAGVVRKLKSLENQIEMVENLSQKKPELEKQKENIEDMLQDVMKQLFVRNEISTLTGKISKLATDAGVEIISFRPLEDKSAFPGEYGAKYSKNKFAFTVEGGYHEIGAFVGLIEGYEKIINVNNISITANKNNPSAHISDMTITGISLTPIKAKDTGAGKKK